MLKGCTTIRHVIEIEFTCPTKDKKVRQEIQSPYISTGYYFEDWSYTYIDVKCKECGKSHSFEL